MSIEKANHYARKARKIAPLELYDVVRALEQAIEQLGTYIGKPGSPRRLSRRSRRAHDGGQLDVVKQPVTTDQAVKDMPPELIKAA